MGISFGSINTGLPKDIVQQIMQAEKIPIKNMEVRKNDIEEKRKLLNELIGLVNAVDGDLLRMTDERSLREFKVKTNEEIINVAIDKNLAQPGNYQFEVESLSRKSSVMSSGVEDPDETYIGVGYVQYYLPNGESRDIYVDTEHSSLNGIAKLINNDSKNGMYATVVNDGSQTDSPWRIIVALEDTGDNNLAEFPYLYFVDGEQDLYLEFEREAQDATIKLDGFPIELEKNSTDQLLKGLTIDLLKASPGEEFSLEIVEDAKKITEKIATVIENLNKVLTFIKKQNTLDENSNTRRTLGGDLTLQTIESKVRTAVFKYVNTEYGKYRIGDLGVTFNKEGLLDFDAQKFEKELAGDYKRVAQILTGYRSQEGEFIDGSLDYLRKATRSALTFPNGILRTRESGLKTNIKNIDRRIADRLRSLERREEILKNKFARLEGTISRIKGQGSGLAGLGAGAASMQQLG